MTALHRSGQQIMSLWPWGRRETRAAPDNTFALPAGVFKFGVAFDDGHVIAEGTVSRLSDDQLGVPIGGDVEVPVGTAVVVSWTAHERGALARGSVVEMVGRRAVVSLSEATEGIQRRGSVRVRTAVTVRARDESGVVMTGSATDLSLGGMLVRLDSTPDGPLQIELALPTGRVTMPARVVDTAAGGQVRLAFGDLSDDVEEHLCPYLASVQRELAALRTR